MNDLSPLPSLPLGRTAKCWNAFRSCPKWPPPQASAFEPLRGALYLSAWAVPVSGDPCPTQTRRCGAPDLHDLVLALATTVDHHHGQGPARQHRHPLDAGNLKPWTKLKANGPAGRFTNAGSTARKLLFISAWSGITPMMSMTTCMWDEGQDLKFVVEDPAAYRPRTGNQGQFTSSCWGRGHRTILSAWYTTVGFPRRISRTVIFRLAAPTRSGE